MHYFSPFHKTIETAIYRKWGEGQEYRFNWYPPFLITLKMKTCNDRIAIYLLNCELNFCICSGFSELCTYLLLLNFNISIVLIALMFPMYPMLLKVQQVCTSLLRTARSFYDSLWHLRTYILTNLHTYEHTYEQVAFEKVILHQNFINKKGSK